MTVVYLQCQNPQCQGFGTRTRTKEKCPCCGQLTERKGETFTCNLCGSKKMKQIKDPLAWEELSRQEQNGKPTFPQGA